MKHLTDKRINSPEGVTALMESIWLRHKLNMAQRPNNVFFVDLPPLSEEEKALIKAENEANNRFDDDGEGIEYWIV
mgnify:CR=1 FL=1